MMGIVADSSSIKSCDDDTRQSFRFRTPQQISHTVCPRTRPVPAWPRDVSLARHQVSHNQRQFGTSRRRTILRPSSGGPREVIVDTHLGSSESTSTAAYIGRWVVGWALKRCCHVLSQLEYST